MRARKQINSESVVIRTAGEFICPDGWQRVPAVNVSDPELFRWAACVLKSDAMAAPLTWDEALADCRGQSAHLLVLADEFYDRYTDPNSVADHGLLAIGHQLVKFVNSTGHYGGQFKSVRLSVRTFKLLRQPRKIRSGWLNG